MIHWDLPDVHQIEVVVAPESIDVLGHVKIGRASCRERV